MYTYTPKGPPGQSVDVDTLVRAVLATGHGHREEMERIAANTLYWLEVSGVSLFMDDEPWSTHGLNYIRLRRLLFEDRSLHEDVEVSADPACEDCRQPRWPTHVASAPGPTVRHPFKTGGVYEIGYAEAIKTVGVYHDGPPSA